jgi:hypothetical protein
MFGKTSLFVDHEKFNCTICDSGNILFDVISAHDVYWDKTHKNYVYVIKCTKCNKNTMHFSKFHIPIVTLKNFLGYGEERTIFDKDKFLPDIIKQITSSGFDSLFFFSVPRGKFEMDDIVPLKLRSIFFEAVDSYRANLITGASACIRKVIYEMLLDKKIIPDKSLEHYTDCIDKLKTDNPTIAPDYFNVLKSITGITSDQLHEQAWDKLESHHLDKLLRTLQVVLYEIYVLPVLRQKQFEEVIGIKKAIEESKDKE